jgi:hypothetical protein
MGAWRCLSSCADEHGRLSAEKRVVMRGRERYLVGGGAYWRSGGAPDMVPVCCAVGSGCEPSCKLAMMVRRGGHTICSCPSTVCIYILSVERASFPSKAFPNTTRWPFASKEWAKRQTNSSIRATRQRKLSLKWSTTTTTINHSSLSWPRIDSEKGSFHRPFRPSRGNGHDRKTMCSCQFLALKSSGKGRLRFVSLPSELLDGTRYDAYTTLTSSGPPSIKYYANACQTKCSCLLCLISFYQGCHR